MKNSLPQERFGRSEERITRVGLGGEGVLRTFGRDSEARQVIFEALDMGITYFDSARAYSGSEAYLGSMWKEQPEARTAIFQTSKSAARDRDGALADLERSLRNLESDHLDLWQIHDVRSWEDLDMIGGPGGALEAFVEARESGRVGHIGVTGHHDPDVLTQAVENWPVDAVLLPVNPVESALGGFSDHTLAAARAKGIATIGMKVLGASHYLFPDQGVTAELLLRFALSQPVTCIVVGCSTPDHVQALARAGQQPLLSEQEQNTVINAFRMVAPKLAYYRGVR